MIGIVIFRSGLLGGIVIIGLVVIGLTRIKVRLFYFYWGYLIFIVFGLELYCFVFVRYWVVLGKLFGPRLILTIFYYQYWCYY